MPPDLLFKKKTKKLTTVFELSSCAVYKYRSGFFSELANPQH